MFGSPNLAGVAVTADSAAVLSDRGDLTIRDSTLSGGSIGVWASSDNYEPRNFLVTIDGSRVFGGTHAVTADSGTTFTMSVRIGASQLGGGPINGTGTVRCVAVHDTSYNSPGYTTCP